MIKYYNIASVIIEIDSHDHINLSRLFSFECEPFLCPAVKVSIRQTCSFPLSEYHVVMEKDGAFVEFEDGRFGYIYHSEEGIPTAFYSSNKDWTQIDIGFTHQYNVNNYSIAELMLGMVFRSIILTQGGLIIHSSAISYCNFGLIFSAPAGTGKSTHTRLWERIYKADIINDDTPAIIPFGDEILVCGTPWSGSSDIFQNSQIPLKAIVVLSRGKGNSIRKLDIEGIVNILLPRCLLPYYDKNLMFSALRNFETITTSVPVYHLECTPTIEAVDVLKAHLKI